MKITSLRTSISGEKKKKKNKYIGSLDLIYKYCYLEKGTRILRNVESRSETGYTQDKLVRNVF